MIKLILTRLQNILNIFCQQQWTEPESEIFPPHFHRLKKKKMLPSLTIIQQQNGRALVLTGLRGSEGIEQVTGSTRHKIAKDAVSGPSSLTPDQFHSSCCKLQIKRFVLGDSSVAKFPRLPFILVFKKTVTTVCGGWRDKKTLMDVENRKTQPYSDLLQSNYCKGSWSA